jgi:hypothetical protein
MSEPIRNAALDLIDHQEDMTHKAKDGFQPGIALRDTRSARLAFKDFVVELRGIELTISQAHF